MLYPKPNNVEALTIHKAIHTEIKDIIFRGKKISVFISPKSKCRTVEIDNYRFIEQNKNTLSSNWSILAKQGQKITWVINKLSKGSFGRIVNETIEVPIPEA